MSYSIHHTFFPKKKRNLIERSRGGKTFFWPSRSFYESKELMKENELHKIIKAMPKGNKLSHDIWYCNML